MFPICEDQETGPARAHGTRRAGRQARSYPSDLTGAQWQVIVPYLHLVLPRRWVVERTSGRPASRSRRWPGTWHQRGCHTSPSGWSRSATTAPRPSRAAASQPAPSAAGSPSMAGGLDGRDPDPAAGSPRGTRGGAPRRGAPPRTGGHQVRLGDSLPVLLSWSGRAVPGAGSCHAGRRPGSGGRGAAARGLAGEMRRRRALPAMSRPGGRPRMRRRPGRMQDPERAAACCRGSAGPGAARAAVARAARRRTPRSARRTPRPATADPRRSGRRTPRPPRGC